MPNPQRTSACTIDGRRGLPALVALSLAACCGVLTNGPLALAAGGAVQEVTFDDVKLEMQKGDPYDASLLTDKVKKLEGKSIRIRGYILPSFQQTGITQFVLVRDNMECCFGPGAMLHDCIIVEMQPPASTTFTTRPVSVQGTFSVREIKDPVNGNHLAIYHLDGTEVK